MNKDIEERTLSLAVPIIKLCQYLEENLGVSRTLSKQLLPSGTSIGANVQEAQAGQSRADFFSKTAIALKEARETHYWLRLLVATEVLSRERILEVQTKIEELTRILGAIVVSTRKPRYD